MRLSNQRELDIVLTALNNMHASLKNGSLNTNLSEIMDLETLSLDEISDLCERLNFGSSEKKIVEYSVQIEYEPLEGELNCDELESRLFNAIENERQNGAITSDSVSANWIKVSLKRTTDGDSAEAESTIRYLDSLQLIDAVWWFVENVDDDNKNKTELFFYMRERVRNR